MLQKCIIIKSLELYLGPLKDQRPLRAGVPSAFGSGELSLSYTPAEGRGELDSLLRRWLQRCAGNVDVIRVLPPTSAALRNHYWKDASL